MRSLHSKHFRLMSRSCCTINRSASEGKVYVIQENGGNLMGPHKRMEAAHNTVCKVQQKRATSTKGFSFRINEDLRPFDVGAFWMATGMMMLTMMVIVPSANVIDDKVK